MDGKRRAGLVIVRIGFIGLALLDFFICLNWGANINGGMWLVSISTGDALVLIAANFAALFSAGHFLAGHFHIPPATPSPLQSNTR